MIYILVVVVLLFQWVYSCRDTKSQDNAVNVDYDYSNAHVSVSLVDNTNHKYRTGMGNRPCSIP